MLDTAGRPLQPKLRVNWSGSDERLAVISLVQRWLGARRLKREQRIRDARRLLQDNPRTAYYDAHRLAAQARFSGDARGFGHWAAVAAEVARLSDNPMDIDVVQAIVDEEARRAGRRTQ